MTAALPLLPMQLAMWLDQRVHGGGSAHNTGDLVEIAAAIDPARFRAALANALARAPALRARLSAPDGTPVQHIAETAEPALEVADLSTEADPAAAAAARFAAALAEPIAWDAPAACRFALLRLAPDRWAFLQVFNHLVTDATGRITFLAQLAAACNDAPLPPPGDYAAVVARLGTRSDDPRAAADRAYWRTRLADPPPLLFPAAPMPQTTRRTARHLPAPLRADLRAAAAQAGVSLPQLLLARIAQTLLHHFGRARLLLGVPLDLRPGAAFADTVGCFATTLPLPIAAAPLADALAALREGLRRDYRHRGFAVGTLTRELRGGDALCDVIVNILIDTERLPPGWRLLRRSHGQQVPLLITLADAPAGNGLELRLDHDPAVLDPARADTLATELAASLAPERVIEHATGTTAPPPSDWLPLLPAQQDMLIDATLFPDSPTYTLATALWFDGPLDAARLARAWNAAVAESEAWRLRFRVDSGALTQQIGPAPTVPLDCIDLSEHTDRDRELAAQMQALAQHVFHPTDAALHKVTLYRLGADRHVALMAYWHPIADGAVRALLDRRIAAHYAADGAAVPPRPAALGIAAVVARLAAYRASPAFEADRAYWATRLADPPPLLVACGPADGVYGRRGEEARLQFTLACADGLAAVAARLGVAPFRVLLTLAGLALARVHDRDALMLGVHMHNRDAPELRWSDANLAGQLPFRFETDPTQSLAATITAIDAALSRDRAHRAFPADAMRALHKSRRLYDVSINYQPGLSTQDFAGTKLWLDGYAAGFFLPWKIDIRDAAERGELTVSLFHDRTLVTPELARAVSEALRCLLQDCLVTESTAELDTPLAALRILPPERARALSDAAWGPRVAHPFADIPALFAARAAAAPTQIAVRDAGGSWTYAALAARAAAIAAALAASGVTQGAVVGVALPRDGQMIAALLGIHRAGAAFLPIDPAHPAARVAWMLQDTGAALVISVAATGANLPAGQKLLRLDAALPAGAPPAPAGPDSMAYVIYTSGSTGTPKGVAVAQRSLANLAQWGAAAMGAPALAGMLFSTALSFDVAMFEIFATLAGGGTILAVDDLLAVTASPLRPAVRIVSGSPTVIGALLRAGGLPPGTSVVVPVGEVLTRELADRIFAAQPGVRLLNAYGPTEATVYASTAEIDPQDRAPPSIGRALDNMALYVLDRFDNLLPEGAEGELCLGGVGVAIGYHDRPALTAERFRPNPFGAGRIYRTGDRARLRPDGAMDFLGRVDFQIKLNGVRIEAGEVEAALCAIPGVAQAVVGLHGPAEARMLVAWFVPQGAAPDAASLRAALARSLPAAYLPAAFVPLPALPVSISGKLDRAALPAPVRPQVTQQRRAASTQMQRALFDLWRDSIDIAAIRAGDFGIDDDLFDLGGDSLTAVLLFSAIEARFGTRVPGEAFAEGISVARLAEFLGRRDRGLGASRLLALQPHGAGRPLYGVHGIGANPLNFYALARTMGTDRPFLAL